MDIEEEKVWLEARGLRVFSSTNQVCTLQGAIQLSRNLEKTKFLSSVVSRDQVDYVISEQS